MDAEGSVRLTLEGAVARVRLSAADTRNAFTTPMMRELAEAVSAADDAGTALIVLEAEGEDFSVGRAPHEEGVTLARSLGQALDTNRAWTETRPVTLTVVQGTALGFAFGLVVQSDLAIVADDASFAFDEMERGFVPKIVLSYLPERMARSLALDLVLSARRIGAREARELGLVARVVPRDSLADAARAYAATLVERGRAGLLRDAKQYAATAMALAPAERAGFALAESLRSMEPPSDPVVDGATS